MDDRANKAYASLPERLYVVQDGQVLYQVRMPIMTTMLVGGKSYCDDKIHDLRVAWVHSTTGSATWKTF